MSTKTTILALTAAALLSPAAALADGVRGELGVQFGFPGEPCDHAAPQPPPNQSGRYELQTVSRWIPESSESVWIPRVCGRGWRRHHGGCSGGYYENRVVPGHYVQV